MKFCIAAREQLVLVHRVEELEIYTFVNGLPVIPEECLIFVTIVQKEKEIVCLIHLREAGLASQE